MRLISWIQPRGSGTPKVGLFVPFTFVAKKLKLAVLLFSVDRFPRDRCRGWGSSEGESGEDESKMGR